MTNGFDAVPLDADGKPYWSTNDPEQYWRYVDWLADYLHRPAAFPGARLSLHDAMLEIIGIESDIASEIWDNPWEDYPPPDLLPPGARGYVDFLRREDMARVLSRVPGQEDRLKLLHRFFTELFVDSRK